LGLGVTEISSNGHLPPSRLKIARLGVGW
jgi:hypothetical protein